MSLDVHTGRGVWLAVRREAGEWRNHYSGEKSDPGWIQGRPGSEGQGRDCTIGIPEYGGAMDYSCSVGGGTRLLCPCERRRDQYLTLRGLCKGGPFGPGEN